jgi:hypothetical protein
MKFCALPMFGRKNLRNMRHARRNAVSQQEEV